MPADLRNLQFLARCINLAIPEIATTERSAFRRKYTRPSSLCVPGLTLVRISTPLHSTAPCECWNESLVRRNGPSYGVRLTRRSPPCESKSCQCQSTGAFRISQHELTRN